MINRINQLNGYRVVVNNSLPSKLKYPTGKKDSNRLGKRRRNQVEYQMLVDNYNKVIYCTDEQFKYFQSLPVKTN